MALEARAVDERASRAALRRRVRRGSRAARTCRSRRFTTFRVGGPADWLIETRNSDEIVAALSTARAAPACR